MAADTDTEQNQENTEKTNAKDLREELLEEHPTTMKVKELTKALEKAHQEVAAQKDQFLRAKADAENSRRRAQLDVEKAHKFGIESFAKEILLVLDSLEHGIEASLQVEDPQVTSVREGMELTHKLLLDTLQKFGITLINPLGETFNPAHHEALTMQPSDEYKPNTVMQVVQKGFLLHERVLRPARVIVSKAVDPSSKTPNVDEKA